jgi:hypothetical protein
MKGKNSKSFWVISGLIILNLSIFILIVGFFGDQPNQVHHHWILPTASALMALEIALAELITGKFAPRTTPLFRKTLLGILVFFCLVGAARYDTIFTCAHICGLKLGLMYMLAAGVFTISAFRFQQEGARTWTRASKWTAFLFFNASALCFLVEMHHNLIIYGTK